MKQLLRQMLWLQSARLTIRYATWRHDRKLKRLNRPHIASDAFLGVPGDSSMLSTILKMCGIVACILVAGFIHNY